MHIPALKPTVTRHPAGGYTLAWPLTGGSARIYTGNYPTSSAANSAVRSLTRRHPVQRVHRNLGTIDTPP
jgi:hypothetical protein